MASLTIRRLDDDVKRLLRLRAAENGRSMEEEAREILKNGLRSQNEPDEPWYVWLHRVAAPLGGLPAPPPRVLEPYRDPFAEE